jgi:hypothetical protein
VNARAAGRSNPTSSRPRAAGPTHRPLAVAPGIAGLAFIHDSAARARTLTALQATAGNAAVQRLLELAVQRQVDGDSVEQVVPAPPLTGRGEPGEYAVEGGCDGLVLHGQANASYNGGSWSVAGQRVTTTGPCDTCPGGTPCLHLTGTLVTNYSVAVAITMPAVPDGLTPCEAGQVRAFLRDVLLPHEKDHERRFKTYNGRTRNPLDLTGCDMDDLRGQVAAAEAAEDAARQAAANALSGAIDPFTRTVDCSSCTD